MSNGLVELIEKAKVLRSLDILSGDPDVIVDMPTEDEYIADYLISNGVIVPPCKVGDKVYIKVRKEKHPFKVTHISITKNGTYYEADRIRNKKENLLYLNDTTTAVFDDAEIGKTVFLTSEEAEAKLKEGEGK